MGDEWIKVPDDMMDMFKKAPYTTMYVLKYGDVGNKWQMSPYHSLEELHKDCLQKGKRWQELVDKVPDDALL